MVDESQKMEIDTKTRLDKAIADLKQLIVCHILLDGMTHLLI